MATAPIPLTMKALVVRAPPPQDDLVSGENDSNNPLENGILVEDRSVPSVPSPSYALIEILRAGICNTDLEILQGYMGFSGVLGHEFVGIVASLHQEASEKDRTKWLGKRVCGDINLGCCNDARTVGDGRGPGVCGVCDDSLGYNHRSNNMSRNHCPNRTVLGILNQDGTFGEYMLLPLRNLHLVPDEIPDEIAVFAEPLAAACRVVEQGLVKFRYDDVAGAFARGGDRVAILGDGKLGLCVAEVLGRKYLRCLKIRRGSTYEKMAPPPVIFGKHQHKLDLVRESGVETRLVSTCFTDEAQEKVSSQEINRYDVVIDATGNPNGLALAMSLCRPMGTLVLKSTCAAGVKGFHSAPIVIDELTVVGSRCGPIDVALDMLRKDFVGECTDDNVPPLRMEKYVTRTFPLSQAREALEFASSKSTMKVQLVMTEKT
ncbi:hypothetical protein ACHAWF_012504 [Thalassiosira exigua]